MPWYLVSWLLLAVQILLFGATAFALPIYLKRRFWAYLLYSVLTGLLWLAYAIGALIFDGFVQHDVPGIVYLLPGVFGWLIGSFVFLVRVDRTSS